MRLLLLILLTACGAPVDTTDTDPAPSCGVDYAPCCDLDDPEDCQAGCNVALRDCRAGRYNGTPLMFDDRTGYDWCWEECRAG